MSMVDGANGGNPHYDHQPQPAPATLLQTHDSPASYLALEDRRQRWGRLIEPDLLADRLFQLGRPQVSG